MRNSIVLLVEDDADHAFFVQRALARLVDRPKVVWAPSLAAARRELMSDRRFSLALVDLQVCGQDGLELLYAGSPDLPPAIVLTTSARAEDEARARELGAIGYLVKPTAPAGYRSIATEVQSFLSAAIAARATNRSGTASGTVPGPTGETSPSGSWR